MKRKALSIFSYIAAALAIFLPWFTYNSRVMGWCWGIVFLKWLAVPMVVIGIYVFSSGANKLLSALAGLCGLLNLTILVLAFGSWQEFRNIKAGFQWNDGFHTATVGYWIAVAAFLVLLVSLQLRIFGKNTRDQD